MEGPTGFGIGFEEYTTVAEVGCEESVGHYRVVAYVSAIS